MTVEGPDGKRYLACRDGSPVPQGTGAIRLDLRDPASREIVVAMINAKSNADATEAVITERFGPGLRDYLRDADAVRGLEIEVVAAELPPAFRVTPSWIRSILESMDIPIRRKRRTRAATSVEQAIRG